MPIARVYVDALNLYYGALRGTPYRWLDLETLFDRLLPGYSVERIVYCTATIKSKPHDPHAGDRQNIYLTALDDLERVEIVRGKFSVQKTRMVRAANASCACCGSGVCRCCASSACGASPCDCCSGSTIEVIKTEEKGSDVNVAAELVKDGLKGNFDAALVVSGDSDIQRAVSIVQDEKRKVITLDPRRRVHSSLVGDEKRDLRPAALAKCQLPSPMHLKSGHVVTAPPGWTK